MSLWVAVCVVLVLGARWAVLGPGCVVGWVSGFPGGLFSVVLRFALCHLSFVCMYIFVQLSRGCLRCELFFLCSCVRLFPCFHCIWGFLLTVLVFPCAFLVWGGVAVSVFAVIGRKRVSVVRLVSRRNARLRGVCMRGGERCVGDLRVGGLWVVLFPCLFVGWSRPGFILCSLVVPCLG